MRLSGLDQVKLTVEKNVAEGEKKRLKCEKWCSMLKIEICLTITNKKTNLMKNKLYLLFLA